MAALAVQHRSQILRRGIVAYLIELYGDEMGILSTRRRVGRTTYCPLLLLSSKLK